MDDQQQKIDLNNATIDELSKLPGIGLKMAQRIVAAQPFESIDDLTRVSGIGESIIEQLEPLVFLSPARAETESPVETLPDIETPETQSKEEVAESIEADQKDADQALPLQEVLAEAAAGQPIPEVEEEHSLQVDQPPAVEPEIHVAPGVAPAEAAPSEPSVDTEAKILGESKPETEGPEDSSTRQEYALAKPERAAKGISPAQVWGIALFSGFLSLVLSIAIVLGLIVGLNGGLQFVRPSQLAALQQQVASIDARATTLENDIQGLRTRIDNLEGLSGRVSSVEKETSQLRSQVDTLTEQANQLNGQVDRLSVMVKELQGNTRRFQLFLDGLRDLLNANQP